MEDCAAVSNLDIRFDRTIIETQKNKEIEYGIIVGNNTIVFIKTGMEGSCYGYENKYVRIGRLLNKKHGCSIISSSNPLGLHIQMKRKCSVNYDAMKRLLKKRHTLR